MPTARNARGIDIIAYDRTGSKFIGVQVKALSKRSPVPLGTDLEKIMGPTAFILLPSEVKQRAHRGEIDGRVSFWLQPAAYDQPIFREAWERLPIAPAPSDEGSSSEAISGA